MKNLKSKKFLILIIIFFAVCFVIIARGNSAESNSKTVEKNTEQAQASLQTIATKLTASGEVESAKTEKIYLNTSYYYLTMCAEENECVKAGDNLLEYTNGKYVTAPYDCVVISYSVPTAKSICTSTDYIYIASTEELYMNININEEQINNISVGQEVEIVSNYDETKTYSGKITKINAIGTSGNGGTTFSAIASLENDGNLKLGMSATCTITIEKLENVLSLPIEAIQFDDDNNRYVNLVKKDGSTEKTVVETGKANENYVQILSGINEGDTVSYETVTVTVDNTETETKTNSLTSLFNMGGNKGPQGKGDFNR